MSRNDTQTYYHVGIVNQRTISLQEKDLILKWTHENYNITDVLLLTHKSIYFGYTEP